MQVTYLIMYLIAALAGSPCMTSSLSPQLHLRLQSIACCCGCQVQCLVHPSKWLHLWLPQPLKAVPLHDAALNWMPAHHLRPLRREALVLTGLPLP